MLIANVFNNFVEIRHVAHVDLSVVQSCSQLFLRSFSNPMKVCRWFREAIKSIHCARSSACRPVTQKSGCHPPVAPASNNASAWVRPRPRAAPDTNTILLLRLNSDRRVLVPRNGDSALSPAGGLGGPPAIHLGRELEKARAEWRAAAATIGLCGRMLLAMRGAER